jgi:formamidopyrimidine-DNA glycosylase
MPELAEVEYFRKQWSPGLKQKVVSVEVHSMARVFRGVDLAALERAVPGKLLLESAAHGKQMIFRFGGGIWLGVHLGMTGELLVMKPEGAAGKHDHLVLRQKKQALVFRDPRLFGRIRFHEGSHPPEWWKNLPPPVLSKGFTQERIAHAALRRRSTNLKAFLLMQEYFPGIGNWMADEILWRARFSPHRKAGSLSKDEITLLRREIQAVSRHAMKVIGTRWGDLPDSWLFNHRWKDGGACPRTGVTLTRETVGGRTTCWSMAWQR